MSYAQRTWVTGDTLTAPGLNNIEAGVGDAHTSLDSLTLTVGSLSGQVASAVTQTYVDNAVGLVSTRVTNLENRFFAPVATSGQYTDLQGRPALAPVATSGAYSDLSGAPVLAAGSNITLTTVGSTTTIAATSTGTSGGGSTNDADFGAVLLDSFQTGSLTDDQLLSAAMSAVGADTYPRTIQLTNRLYSFSTGGITPYEGFRLRGAWGFSNPERNSGNKVAAPVSLNMTGAWFTSGSSTIFGCSFENLALEGHGTNATFLGSGSGTWDCLLLRDIYASALRSVLGTQANKLLITASTFGGSWEINNSYSGAFHLGGSDNSLLWEQCLIDAAPAFATSGGSSGQAHFWADGLDKTVVGPMYITAEGVWRGIKHDGAALNSGSTNAGSVQYLGVRLEGRNPSQPCNGSLLVQNGGTVDLSGLWIAYGMASPSAGENGVVQHNGGQLAISGITYDTPTQAAITTPFVHTVGGVGLDVLVSRIKRASRGAVSWGTSRPVVARATAGAENRIADATVTLTTV